MTENGSTYHPPRFTLMPANESTSPDDPHDLRRFTTAQEGVYERALAEMRPAKSGLTGCGSYYPRSPAWDRAAPRNITRFRTWKRREYLDHPILGPRLRECAEAVLAVEGRTVLEIFGYPDDLKLRSCMTLFAKVAEPDSVFERVLEKYFGGANDGSTLEILARLEQGMS